MNEEGRGGRVGTGGGRRPRSSKGSRAFRRIVVAGLAVVVVGLGPPAAQGEGESGGRSAEVVGWVEWVSGTMEIHGGREGSGLAPGEVTVSPGMEIRTGGLEAGEPAGRDGSEGRREL